MIGGGWDPPPASAGTEDFRWFHISGVRPLIAVVTCELPIWYRGHYHGNRMQPCTGEACDLCAMAVGSQVRFVFSLADCSQRAHGLLETGSGIAQEIRDLAARSGHLKGLMVEIQKHTLSRKSRMEVQEVLGDPGEFWKELPAIDLGEALRATWSKAGMKLPDSNLDPDACRKSARVRSRVSSALKASSDRVR